MTNNDILRRLRFVFDCNDSRMMELFSLGGERATREQVSAWLKQDDKPDFVELNDKLLATFLNGLIVKLRGAREGGVPVAESRLNNNIILRKLKIALDFKDDDVLGVMDLAEFPLSKHELSAFFRKADHHNYRECQTQVLRNFLRGLQLKLRGDLEDKGEPAAES